MAIRNMWREVMGLAKRYVEATEDNARTMRGHLAIRKEELRIARERVGNDARMIDAAASVEKHLSEAKLAYEAATKTPAEGNVL